MIDVSRESITKKALHNSNSASAVLALSLKFMPSYNEVEGSSGVIATDGQRSFSCGTPHPASLHHGRPCLVALQCCIVVSAPTRGMALGAALLMCLIGFKNYDAQFLRCLYHVCKARGTCPAPCSSALSLCECRKITLHVDQGGVLQMHELHAREAKKITNKRKKATDKDSNCVRQSVLLHTDNTLWLQHNITGAAASVHIEYNLAYKSIASPYTSHPGITKQLLVTASTVVHVNVLLDLACAALCLWLLRTLSLQLCRYSSWPKLPGRGRHGFWLL